MWLGARPGGVENMGAPEGEGLVDRIAAAVAARLTVPPPKSLLTWRQLWEPYAEAEHEKLASWDTVVGRWRHIDQHIGGDCVMDGTIHTLRRYRGVRAKELTPYKRPTTATTRNREIEVILRMARWASRQKPPLIPHNPFAGLEREDVFEAVENVRRNIVEDDPEAQLSIWNLLEGADPFECALVLVDHSSGMRRRELALLERAWIDWGERIIEIPPGVAKGRRGQRPGRQTFIRQDALDAIEAYWETLPFPHRYRSPFVFCNPRTGGHYSYGHLSVRFRALRDRRGFIGPSGPVTLHDAGRRSFITLHRRRGEDISNIMKASGHKTQSAFDRYNIHALKDTIAVRDRIEAARERELAAKKIQRRGPVRSPTGDNDLESRSKGRP